MMILDSGLLFWATVQAYTLTYVITRIRYVKAYAWFVCIDKPVIVINDETYAINYHRFSLLGSFSN